MSGSGSFPLFRPDSIFRISHSSEFENYARHLFQYQSIHCHPYAQFLKLLNFDSHQVHNFNSIPFLPVEIFKSHQVVSEDFAPHAIFTSSGTTSHDASKHYVKDLGWYEHSFKESFRFRYGDYTDYCFLCLLPSYLERHGSSLVYMADYFITNSKYPQSGFFLYNHLELVKILEANQAAKIPTILLGVSFALLDLATEFQIQIPDIIVMETGGMKGRRKELLREELHGILKESWGVSHIHSEYGMTELMSQAYSTGNGVFKCPPWMNVFIKDPYEPQKSLPLGSTGLIHILDLANIQSCGFIATADLGKLHPDGSFEVIGRLDRSEIRGCNLMLNQ